MNPPKLFIFDSTNLFHRSFHGNEKLTGPGGFPTGAIYGFIVSVQLVLQKYPDYQPVFVFDNFPESAVPRATDPNARTLISTIPVLDSGDLKTRREIYPEYKATRSAMAPELQQQALPLLLILNAMGYPLVSGNSVLEADDVMGTLAVEAQKRGGHAIIATSDKDMAAMVNDNCQLYNFTLKDLLNAEGIEKKYGVSPEKIPGYLALMGDAVDNIPGVVKCGDKTAAKWMNKYGTFEEVLAHADDISGVVGDNLRKALPTLPMSYSLTLLRTDTPVAFEACTTPRARDEQLLRHMYQGLGFQKFLHQMDSLETAKSQQKPSVTAPHQSALELA